MSLTRGIQPGKSIEKRNIKSLISQGIRLIPIIGPLKNIYDTIGHDIVSILKSKKGLISNKFTTKEKIFKTASGGCSIAFWTGTGIVAYHYEQIDSTIQMLISTLLLTSLQTLNRVSYGIGVYYSQAIQDILSEDGVQSTRKERLKKFANHIKPNTKKE